MTWMLTTTGAVVDLRFVAGDQISALDIAAALSKINRFNGHTTRLYSVAEHSVHVVRVLEEELRVTDPAALFAALLHDAHEAYVGDLSTPLKQTLGPRWAEVEAQVEHAVHARFGAWPARVRWADQIKAADLLMLAVERRDLLPAGGPPWPLIEGLHLPLGLHLADYDGLTPDDWRDVWLDKFAELHTAARFSTEEDAAT
ncbi:MAG: HD family hydrolase [Burkholderiaceae bacterium]|jgi:hypothetical protein|nr:HD family hydrolase [Burkholderiaceae bacterium]MCU0964057.1 HD family hydrolase [Burkholderiaceae bacterium]